MPAGGLHSWQGKSTIRDAYIVWALCEAGYGQKISEEIEYALKNAKSNGDPYELALLANALLSLDDSRGKDILNDLIKRQKDDGSWQGKDRTVTNSTGKGLVIETTALTVLALLKANKQAHAAKAIQYIANARSGYGFGNTQSTVLALKALVAYAQASKKNER